MTNQSHIKQLFERYATKEATPDEIRELYQLAHDGQFDDELKTLLIAKLEDTDISDSYNTEEWSAVFDKIKDDISAIEEDVPVKRKQFGYARVGIAAAVAFIVFGVYFFNYRNHDIRKHGQQDAVMNDVAPGQVGATLTLASGKKIRLTDAANGELAKEAGVTITKSEDGQLTYEIKGISGESNQINTLSTAKGETYILTLPDKSKVWLNAASSLTYAASLIERGKRVVRLSGEGYFQVAKDKAHPFVVESGGQRVEVLGTHFNVSAYENDPQIKTTLEEGSIKIAFGAESRILKPNQQAVLSGANIQVKNVDAELALAWKSGFFLFDRERLESIMDKLERWYDVDVIYSDPSLKSRIFTGTISRFEKISEVLNMLESTEGVRFKIEDRKIIISKRN